MTTQGKLAAVLVLGIAAGCGAEGDGLGGPADGTRRRAGSAGQVDLAGSASPPPAANPAPASSGNATVIVRAEKIAASRIVARLIYAEKIEAESAAIADLRRDEGKLWESEGAKADLVFDELRADTIYTKEIKVSALEAGQVFAKDVQVTGPIKSDGNGNEGKGKDQDDD